MTGVKCNITSAYHPQSNGQDERFNQTLQRQLLKFVSEEQNDWDLYLDSIAFSYRVSRQDSTKASPFYLVYGRQARLPIELNIKPEEGEPAAEPSTSSDLKFDEYISDMIKIRRRALENIQAAQERQKGYYDAKHGKDKSKYQVGELVLVKNSKKLSRKGSKMEPNWHGPYRIHEILGKGTFKLCHVDDSKKVLAQIFNMTRLKLYHQRDEDAPPADDEDIPPANPPMNDSPVNTGAPTTDPTDPPINAGAPTTDPPVNTGGPTTDPTNPPINAGAPTTDPTVNAGAPTTDPPVNNTDTGDTLPSVTCSCKTRCATRKCPCKREHRACSEYCHPGRACINTSQLAERKADKSCEIDLTKEPDMPTNQVDPETWTCVGSVKLTVGDKETLKSNSWLCDRLISAAQQLLHKQHPHIGGLQDPILQRANTFEPQTGEFVQCLNVRISVAATKFPGDRISCDTGLGRTSRTGDAASAGSVCCYMGEV